LLGRPRQFEEEQALEQAMHLFWEHGYEATSTRELAQCMGLKPQSLYNTFGDKHSLFLKTLDHYQKTQVQYATSLLRNPDANLDTIRHWLSNIIHFNDHREHPLACLMAISAMEKGHVDEEVSRRVQSHLNQLEQLLIPILERDQLSGKVQSSSNPRELATYLTGILQGLLIFVRAGKSHDEQLQYVDTALRLLQ
jgi:TetR/AcrR family transcriptional regulator, transcriptional repressor for nem operon